MDGIPNRFAALLMLSCLVIVGTGAAAADEDGAGDKKLTPREREIMRIGKVMEWAQKTKAPETEVTKRILAPIIMGNQKDAERNSRMAEQFSELAGQAKKNKEDAVARKYQTVATLFAECAKENQRFLKAIKQGDAANMKEALKHLNVYDERIEEITGKRVDRGWYMLEEMVDSIKSMQAGGTGPVGAAN